MHIHIVSFPHLWLALIRELITIDELKADNVIFHFACSRAHLLELEKDRYPVEIGWFEREGKLNIKLPPMQFCGLLYGSLNGTVSAETIFVTGEQIDRWNKLQPIIEKADQQKRIEWLCDLFKDIPRDSADQVKKFEDFDDYIPRYIDAFDRDGKKIGAFVTWKTDGQLQTFLLGVEGNLHLGWKAETADDRPGFHVLKVKSLPTLEWLKF